VERNNHGSHARVGDLVEILNPQGQLTGITGLVSAIVTRKPLGDFDDSGIHMKFLEVTGQNGRIKDCYVVVRSFRA